MIYQGSGIGNQKSGTNPAWLVARIFAVLSIVLLAGCGSAPRREVPAIERQTSSAAPGVPASASTKKGGGYYLDDGPGDNPPPNLGSIADAVPRIEPLRKANMRPYVALGKTYTPVAELGAYKERGIASWYGRRYHGQKTASGEIYDMYGMTAAHTTLPLPSYARVTNIRNGKSVVVRINDRGPFHSDRLIDLSYTAAYKLGVLGGGSAQVEVESILPGAEPAAQIAEASPELADPSPIKARKKTEAPLMTEKQNGEAKPDLFEVIAVSEPAPAPAPASATAASSDGTTNHSTDETPSHSTRLSKNDNQVAGYRLANNASQVAGYPAPAATGTIYLQLGAFGARDNAENFLARMRAELPAQADTLGIIVKDGLFKVHAGPYADQSLARQAADKIAQSLAIKPILLMR